MGRWWLCDGQLRFGVGVCVPMTDKIVQVTSLLLLIRGEFKRKPQNLGLPSCSSRSAITPGRGRGKRGDSPWGGRPAPTATGQRQPPFPGTGRSGAGLEHPGRTWRGTKNRSPVISLTSQQIYVKGQPSREDVSTPKLLLPPLAGAAGGWSRWGAPFECREECGCLSLESLQHFNRPLICCPSSQCRFST